VTPDKCLQLRREAEELRMKANGCKGVGESLRNLAPVLAQELTSLVSLKLRTGRLADEWDEARAAAAKSSVEADQREMAALAALLMGFAREAGKRVMVHGDQLVEQRSELEGRAKGIEEALVALEPEQPDEAVPSA